MKTVSVSLTNITYDNIVGGSPAPVDDLPEKLVLEVSVEGNVSEEYISEIAADMASDITGFCVTDYDTEIDE